MPVYFFSEEINFTLPSKKVYKNWIKEYLCSINKKIGDINIIFTSDNHLVSINKEYLKRDYFTDIITFDYSEDDIIHTDIFISVDRVKDNAQENKVNFQNELERIIIHGILHVTGFDDCDPLLKKAMTEKEDELLTLLEKLK